MKSFFRILFFIGFFVSVLELTYGSPVQVQDITRVARSIKPTDNCVCETFSCECCGTLTVPEIKLNDTFCLSVAYLPKDYGLSLVIEIDDKVLINETISAKNPPPICLPIPYIEDFFDFCVHFTDLKITNDDFHGCAILEARMWWVYVVAEIHLGCWDTAAANATKTIDKSFVFGKLPEPSLELAGKMAWKATNVIMKKSKTITNYLPVKHLLNHGSQTVVLNPLLHYVAFVLFVTMLSHLFLATSKEEYKMYSS